MTEAVDTTQNTVIEQHAAAMKLLAETVQRTVQLKRKPSPRPKGWRNGSNAPYYKEAYARDMKAVFDMMMKDGANYQFECRNYPKISVDTLYQQVNQATLYLIENLDTPDQLYSNFYSQIKVRRIPKRINEVTGKIDGGVLCEIVPIANRLIASPVPTADTMVNLKNDLQAWLSDPDGPPRFFRERLALKESEIEMFEMMMYGVPNLVGRVTGHEIVILRTEHADELREAMGGEGV